MKNKKRKMSIRRYLQKYVEQDMEITEKKHIYYFIK